MALTRIDHVGVAVRDLDAAVEFYQRTFRMRCVLVEANADQAVREAMMTLPDGSTQVQLLEPTGAASPIARFLDRSGPGIHHIAYRVDDVVAEAADLAANGLRVLYAQPRRGTSGSLINFVHPTDTAGVLVEIVQRADDDTGIAAAAATAVEGGPGALPPGATAGSTGTGASQ